MASRRLNSNHTLIYISMKTALLINGISYGPRGRDWRRGKENLYDNIIEPLNADVYLNTYPNETTQELIDFYRPKKVQLIEFAGSDPRTTIKQGIEMLSDVDFDLAITTRFDIKWNAPISQYNIDPTKINFLFREKGWWDESGYDGYKYGLSYMKYTSDITTFSAFPKKFIPVLAETIQEVYRTPHRYTGDTDLHPLYSYLLPKIGEENMHIVCDQQELSHQNTQYHYDRISL